jgi:hypothetical protein
VAVVAAAVHHAGARDFQGEVVVLGQRQCIHVGAQAVMRPLAGWRPLTTATTPVFPMPVVDLVHAAQLQRFLDAAAV